MGQNTTPMSSLFMTSGLVIGEKSIFIVAGCKTLYISDFRAYSLLELYAKHSVLTSLSRGVNIQLVSNII